MVGQTLGHYLIEERLGQGGMGEVYLARDQQLDRPVAIKVLRPHLAADAEMKERFLAEARLAARVEHPHIVKVYDAGHDGDTYYFAMSYVGGGNLADLLAQGPLPLPAALALLVPLCEALDAAHAHGLVHRDIKPSNVLLDHGRPMLVDFGIARTADGLNLTMTGQMLGTPAYMSPEQCDGQRVDGRSDLYSLAVVAYQMLAGQTPFQHATPLGLAAAHIRDAPPPLPASLGLPARVQTAFDRALSKDPAQRFATAAEFAAALSTPEPPGPPPRRAGVWPSVVAGLLCAGLALVAVSLRSHPPAVAPGPPTRTTTTTPPVLHVPDVVGLPSSEARVKLTSEGFNVGLISGRPDRAAPKGVVLAQSPTAGSELARGSLVDLVLSNGHLPDGPRPGTVLECETPEGTGLAMHTAPSDGAPRVPSSEDGEGAVPCGDRMAVRAVEGNFVQVLSEQEGLLGWVCFADPQNPSERWLLPSDEALRRRGERRQAELAQYAAEYGEPLAIGGRFRVQTSEGGGLAFRSWPGQSARVYARVPDGTTGEVVDVHPPWWARVRLGNERVGWLMWHDTADPSLRYLWPGP